MQAFSTEFILILLSAVVVLSYLFSILSRYIKVPSVMLLLFSGIALRAVAESNNWGIVLPGKMVEFLGVTGLIMIILEAGLDLKLGRSKLKLIRNSFFAALIIFLLSVTGITIILDYFLHEPLRNCIIYATPLSIMSSSIVIPSLHHLTSQKKEFLVYEASFSDILGILVFNMLTEGQQGFSGHAVGMFFVNIALSLVLSIIFSSLLFLILTRSKLNIRFFLVFALLIFLYVGGKMLHLPSLIVILIFGMLMNNWELVRIPILRKLFPRSEVQSITHLLHSLTAESSFLIRTFFFILFGYSIDLKLIAHSNVITIGSLIVLVLFIARFLYLRFFLKENVYPEVMFIPRGLITILLFYKIPEAFKLQSFNEGILFFVVLITGIILMLGTIFYRRKKEEVVEGT
ncbi:cation:proton antiporter domain-containing protein [Foetidibacter luteolus]|uniref:cation:proton antiporter domain-containing protein n=1 Tax=Foetidibacter luteolus TaxID=2608880 RepID=UPI00129BFBDE|nr:cation:proton antiporter [Foetidibacter luteolus]